MSNTTTKDVLSMDFIVEEGKSKSIRVTDPKPDLTAAQVQTAMETLADLRMLEVFTYTPPQLKGAKTIQTITNKFDIVIA